MFVDGAAVLGDIKSQECLLFTFNVVVGMFMLMCCVL